MNLIAQVDKAIKQHSLIARGDKIVVAVSGGPDSLTLLHLLLALRNGWQMQLHVAHLNHQLRGVESDADAEFVAGLAREWNLPATIESRDVAAYAQNNKVSIEQAAREMRYAFLVEVAQNVGARSIAVAHNADDQVETVLMHLLRGAGMAGLRGMQYKSKVANHQVTIIRPLLDVTRSEIEEYCKDNSLDPRFDRSNLDTTLFRNRLRHEILPYLESINPKIRKVLLHSSRSITDDFDYIERQARDAFLQVTDQARDRIVFRLQAWRQLHPALQRLTLRLAIQQLRRDLRNVDWAHIENARRVALEGGAGAVATLPRGLHLTAGYNEFVIGDKQLKSHLSDIPQLNVECIPLPKQGRVELPGSDWAVETIRLSKGVPLDAPTNNWIALFDSAKIAGSLFLRRRRAGDQFQPAGMSGHTKSLHKFMIDGKIPRTARGQLPLLVDSEKILWVCGYRVDERVRVNELTREILQVTLRTKS